MRIAPDWFDVWTTTDEDVLVNGIEDDALENIKKEYEKYLEEKKNLEKRN